jgi:hypothetical protein
VIYSSIIKSPIYWLTVTLTTLTLLTVGLVVAWIVVPEPPTYHRTTYFEFALPSNWYCNQEGSETVCWAREKEKVATIIFAAKLRNKNDTLQVYYDHLVKPKTFITPDDGQSVTSSVQAVKRRNIANSDWVDALHYQSEVPNYYTRYLATNTSELGIVVTFSYHQDAPVSVAKAFEVSIGELNIYQN